MPAIAALCQKQDSLGANVSTTKTPSLSTSSCRRESSHHRTPPHISPSVPTARKLHFMQLAQNWFDSYTEDKTPPLSVEHAAYTLEQWDTQSMSITSRLDLTSKQDLKNTLQLNNSDRPRRKSTLKRVRVDYSSSSEHSDDEMNETEKKSTINGDKELSSLKTFAIQRSLLHVDADLGSTPALMDACLSDASSGRMKKPLVVNKSVKRRGRPPRNSLAPATIDILPAIQEPVKPSVKRRPGRPRKRPLEDTNQEPDNALKVDSNGTVLTVHTLRPSASSCVNAPPAMAKFQNILPVVQIAATAKSGIQKTSEDPFLASTESFWKAEDMSLFTTSPLLPSNSNAPTPDLSITPPLLMSPYFDDRDALHAAFNDTLLYQLPWGEFLLDEDDQF